MHAHADFWQTAYFVFIVSEKNYGDRVVGSDRSNRDGMGTRMELTGMRQVAKRRKLMLVKV